MNSIFVLQKERKEERQKGKTSAGVKGDMTGGYSAEENPKKGLTRDYASFSRTAKDARAMSSFDLPPCPDHDRIGRTGKSTFPLPGPICCKHRKA